MSDTTEPIEPQLTAQTRATIEGHAHAGLGASPRRRVWVTSFASSPSTPREMVPVAVMATMKEMKTTDLKKVVDAVKANPKTKRRFDDYGLVPVYGPRHISSGPGFVTKENIAKVEKYAGQYR